MSKVAMAVAAHPDDIEMMMGGTLIMLKRAGCEIHYMNVANGSCGTDTLDKNEIVAIRTAEAQDAADLIGAVFHPPLVDDLQIIYTESLAAKLCAIVRRVDPQILLLPSPQDYMEDHMNTSRLMVTAAFCRNIVNFPTDPPTPPLFSEMCLYHGLPWGLRDQLRKTVDAGTFVDVSSVMADKRRMLACHRSQKEWLDRTQGLESYLTTTEDLAAQVGRLSGRFTHAEGWRRHLHLGFGREEFDPLSDALGKHIISLDQGELP